MALRRKTLFSIILLTLPSILFAMNVEITVIDEDLEMPLEGAVVSLRDGRQYICDHWGIAAFTLPDGAQSIIQISYPGYDARRMTIMAVEKNAPERITIALRLSGGVMEGRELVIEAQRPETSETRTGRSVAISEQELARTAEIGIIEDVMSSVKLLPGVGYTGMFGALPSIRGGDPGDMTAVFDGFYLERPFHWVSAVSIFDPKMVSGARLSHGVFSTRYGHTISGLLEVASKSPSPTETEFELGIGSSAASMNLSVPLNGKGGILFMGKLTYWETLLWAAQGLSTVTDNETLDMVNYITKAPYIGSAALAANYRFTHDLEWKLNFFLGSDGVTAEFDHKYDDANTKGTMSVDAIYKNYQGFLISGITASPTPVLAIKATGGIGLNQTITDTIANNNITVRYNQNFLDDNPIFKIPPFSLTENNTYTAPDVNVAAKLKHTILSAQARADIDWDLGSGFIAAFGVQELYSRWAQKQIIDLMLEFALDEIPDEYLSEIPLAMQSALAMLSAIPNLALVLPKGFSSDIINHGFTSSAYGLVEYVSPDNRFGAELGLRIDHLYIFGKDFSFYTLPAFNPRLNLDFNILKNQGIIDSLDITFGTGLFSSVNSFISFIDGKNFDINEIKFDRSFTTVAGFKIDLASSYSFNIETYYKRVFDRGYITADVLTSANIRPEFHFDGIGNVWGFDLQLQKLESRFWDGWISYTFTWAKYFDPQAGGEGVNMGGVDSVGNEWYFPSFHRYHNCNIVLNYKPVKWFTLSTRIGFASGTPDERRVLADEITSYPVLAVDDDGNVTVVQKYRREVIKTVSERSRWSWPWDLKLSFYLFDKKGRVGTEMYLAAENLMSIFYPTKATVRLNEYTGVETKEPSIMGGSAMFDLPIPLVSFGFKWRY